MQFSIGAYRNKKDVVSKFIAGFLLPSLGYAPGKRPGEVRIADFRLDFLLFLRWLLPVPEKPAEEADVVALAVHPGERLEKYVRKISRYLTVLDARQGILTNGVELRLYERFSGDSVELLFRCQAEELATRMDSFRRIFRESGADAENASENSSDEVVSRDGGSAPVEDSVVEGAMPADVSVGVEEETVAGAEPPPAADESIAVDVSVSADESIAVEEDATPPRSEEAVFLPQPAAPAEDAPRMKVIAVYHNKGGVGKTTIAVNLAAALRKKGHRILLIDMDAQANATFAAGLIKFQFEEEDDILQRYVYHLLESGDSNFIPDLVRRSKSFNTPEIDVVPSHIDLIVHQDTLTQIAVSRSRLMTKLRRIEADYDFVIIDTPPSRDLYAEIPLIAADYLIVPSDLRPFANQGLRNVRNFVDEVNEYRESIAREPLVVLGVLPSKIPTNAQYLKYTFPRQKRAVPDRYGFALMESVIYDRMPLSTALSRVRKVGEAETPDPKSIFEFCAMEGSGSAGQSADDFEALADEILTKTL